MSKCLDINGVICQNKLKTQAFLNRVTCHIQIGLSYSWCDSTDLHNNCKILITQLLGEWKVRIFD